MESDLWSISSTSHFSNTHKLTRCVRSTCGTAETKYMCVWRVLSRSHKNEIRFVLIRIELSGFQSTIATYDAIELNVVWFWTKSIGSSVFHGTQYSSCSSTRTQREAQAHVPLYSDDIKQFTINVIVLNMVNWYPISPQDTVRFGRIMCSQTHSVWRVCFGTRQEITSNNSTMIQELETTFWMLYAIRFNLYSVITSVRCELASTPDVAPGVHALKNLNVCALKSLVLIARLWNTFAFHVHRILWWRRYRVHAWLNSMWCGFENVNWQSSLSRDMQSLNCKHTHICPTAVICSSSVPSTRYFWTQSVGTPSLQASLCDADIVRFVWIMRSHNRSFWRFCFDTKQENTLNNSTMIQELYECCVQCDLGYLVWELLCEADRYTSEKAKWTRLYTRRTTSPCVML